MAPVPVLRVGQVRRLLAVGWGREILMRRVLQVGRWVVMVVVVIRRGVLGYVAELAVVNGDGCVCLRPGCVVQVGRVRGVGNEGGVHGLRGGAGRLDASGAKQRSEQRGGAGQGLAAVA